ncbi:hypothetical protein AAHA92_14224 [Salvia divinorum]|uniref:Uncharacterized protein n=1 Tax=Salvia divinorum TaxID=28513 RepID=A0ABD1HC77_SALDI
MEEVVRKRFRVELESDVDSPAVKRLREDLLDGIDDDSDFSTSTQDLDSFMKSFEEEITASPASGLSTGAANDGVLHSRPDLGYLLEASDDELGIPPPTASPVSTALVTVESDSSELRDEFWEVPGHDTFGFGFGEVENSIGEYVALDGLFDYSDMGFGSGDHSWRPERLPFQ